VKYLIVGLGNPGSEYNNTRHNIGFNIIDTIVNDQDADFESLKYGYISRVKFKGRTLIFLKPNTFMNLSGKAVNYWLNLEKLSVDNLLVVTDDLSLPFGYLRLKSKGSSGGHNGLKDISNVLGDNIYPRLRFGIGNDFPKGNQTNYVLGNWNKDQSNEIKNCIEEAKKIIYSFCIMGIDQTMNNLNKK
jgi:PTH1 family peptidyl-tRNA hydrolase|tara:strand:- start:1500 stop:2063 length:564 start_codon:yes stop_codon:yes gene_type:complete